MSRLYVYSGLSIFLCICLGISVYSQNKKALLLNLRIDEDYLNYRLKGTDRYYTGGLDCSFFYESKKKWFHTRLHHHKIK
ncbi:MAG: hypothetical protein KA160_05305, partial [Lacibacter sp.]|nr:hypothetical protein [Lacibacter sp.]